MRSLWGHRVRYLCIWNETIFRLQNFCNPICFCLAFEQFVHCCCSSDEDCAYGMSPKPGLSSSLVPWWAQQDGFTIVASWAPRPAARPPPLIIFLHSRGGAGWANAQPSADPASSSLNAGEAVERPGEEVHLRSMYTFSQGGRRVAILMFHAWFPTFSPPPTYSSPLTPALESAFSPLPPPTPKSTFEKKSKSVDSSPQAPAQTHTHTYTHVHLPSPLSFNCLPLRRLGASGNKCILDVYVYI